MKKNLKKISILAIAILLAGCNGKVTSLSVGFNGIQIYISNHADEFMTNVYKEANFSGNCSYLLKQKAAGVQIEHTIEATYEVDFKNSTAHFWAKNHSAANYTEIPENSYDSTNVYEYYYVLDKKEGLVFYYEDGGEIGKTIKASVSELYNLAMNEGSSIEVVANKYIIQSIKANCTFDILFGDLEDIIDADGESEYMWVGDEKGTYEIDPNGLSCFSYAKGTEVDEELEFTRTLERKNVVKDGLLEEFLLVYSEKYEGSTESYEMTSVANKKGTKVPPVDVSKYVD